MEWRNGESYESKPGHEVPEGPRLLMDIAEAELVTYATEEVIPRHELMYLQRPILGFNSLALRLYRNYVERTISKPISPNDYYLLDIDVVPAMFSSAEQALISAETGDAYVVSDAYARYAVRLKCDKEWGTTRNRRQLGESVSYVQLRDKQDDGNLVEFFLNADKTVDVQIMLNGWQDERKPATVLQKVILARTLEDLLDPSEP